MKANVGGIDKMLRIFVGLLIIAVGLISENWLGLIGLIPLATAAVGFCPAYLPFGFNTCTSPKAPKDQSGQ